MLNSAALFLKINYNPAFKWKKIDFFIINYK